MPTIVGDGSIKANN